MSTIATDLPPHHVITTLSIAPDPVAYRRIRLGVCVGGDHFPESLVPRTSFFYSPRLEFRDRPHKVPRGLLEVCKSRQLRDKFKMTTGWSIAVGLLVFVICCEQLEAQKFPANVTTHIECGK